MRDFSPLTTAHELCDFFRYSRQCYAYYSCDDLTCTRCPFNTVYPEAGLATLATAILSESKPNDCACVRYHLCQSEVSRHHKVATENHDTSVQLRDAQLRDARLAIRYGMTSPGHLHG